jgi:AcrR family transcriptional regulator
VSLLRSAALLFDRHGFHNVSMGDIAQSVGLKGPALYRHFGSKHEVLNLALTDQITALLDVVKSVETVDPPQARLDQLLAGLTKLVLDRDGTLLWKRERRHLTGDEETTFVGHARELVQLTGEIVRGVRPGITDADARLLGWSLLSVYAHTRTYKNLFDKSAIAELLLCMGRAVASADALRPAEPPASDGWAARVTTFGRRERIMAESTALLVKRGYREVSIEQIAEASDTAIATVYQYFDGKADLLYRILMRGGEGVHYVLAQITAGVIDPSEALRLVVDGYVKLTLGTHGRLLQIQFADLLYLPEAPRKELLRTEREFVEHWAGLLEATRPELTPADAIARAQTAVGVVSDLSQTRRIRVRAGAAEEIAAIAWAVLQS